MIGLGIGLGWRRPGVGASGGGAPPGIPQNLIAEPGDSLVTLDWDAVVGATTYNVYRGGVFLKDVDALGTEAVDDTAVNGVTYSYTVSATGPGGESAQSAAATATPSSGDWILSGGVWSDSATWDDSATWND